MPHIFRLINHDLRVFEYSFADYETELQSALKGTRAILDGREVPTATYNASEWPWERVLNEQGKE
jgi:hypothetical protein